MKIMLGLLVGQGLIFGSLPLITRLYSTAEVGYSGTFLAAASIVGAVATFRLETLLPSASDSEATWLTTNAFRSLLAVSILSCLGFFLFQRSDIANALLFGLTVAGLGGVVLALQSATRREKLNGVAVSKASQGVGQVGIQVLAGLAGLTKVGMQAGIAAGYLLSAAVQWIALRIHRRATVKLEVPIETKRARWRQAFTLTVAGFLNIGAIWMYPLLTQFFFGSVATGHLTVAQRLVLVPAGLMVAAFAPVVVGSVGATIRAGQGTRPQLLRLIRRLAPLGLATLISTLVVPRSWVVLLLGDEWGAAKDYLAALGPAAALQVAVGPLGLILILQGRTRTQLIWDCTRTLTLLTTMTLTAIASESAVATIWAGSLTFAFFYFVYLWLILHQDSRSAVGLGKRKTRGSFVPPVGDH